jgi:uncharacterized protein HemX
MEAGSTKTPTGSQPAAAAGSEPAAAPQTTEEQIEGLRAWIAQIDRRLGIRSFAGGAAVVLALAAGIVGVVLAMSAKDESATKTEVKALRDQVSATTQEASQATQDDISQINDSIDALEARVSTLASGQRTSDSELEVVQDDIDELRGQITDLETAASAANSASPPDTGNTGNP